MEQVVELPEPEKKPSRRRSKAPEDIRNKKFHILISETDREKLETQADNLGVSVSDVFRMAVLGSEGFRKDPKVQQWTEVLHPTQVAVGKMTQNLNHIAHRCNLDAVMNLPFDELEVEGRLAEMLAEMRQVRDELGDQIVTLSKMI